VNRRLDWVWYDSLLLVDQALHHEGDGEEALSMVNEDVGTAVSEGGNRRIKEAGHRFTIAVVVEGLARRSRNAVALDHPLAGDPPKDEIRRVDLLDSCRRSRGHVAGAG
jgi:hypothetical protein